MSAANFQGNPDVFATRNVTFAIRSPRRLGRLDERDPASGVVSGSLSSVDGGQHVELLLHQVVGAYFVYACNAGSRREHGAVPRHCGSLRRDRLFGVTAKARDRNSQGAGGGESPILNMIIGQGIKPVLIGVAIGIAGTLGLTRF